MEALYLLNEKQNTEVKTKAGIIDIIIAFGLVLSIFFEQYSSFIPGINVGEIILLVGTLCILFRCRFNVSFTHSKYLYICYFIAIIFSLLQATKSDIFVLESSFEIYSRWIRFGIYIIIFNAYIDNFTNKNLILKIYKYVSIFIALYTILQAIVYLTTGIYLPIDFFPFLTRTRSANFDSIVEEMSNSRIRFYGIFDEPSYLIKYLLPAFVITLFNVDGKKNNLFFSIIILTTILISTSMQGIILAFIVIVLFICFNNKVSIFHRILIMIMLFLFFLLMINMPFMEAVKTRFNSMFISKESNDYSTNIRLYRGFAIWDQLSFKDKILGIGIGNSANFTEYYNIVTKYDYYFRDVNTLNYMNGFAKMLVEYGLISSIFFVVFLAKEIYGASKSGKAILITFILILLSSSLFISLTMIFYLFFAINVCQKNNEQC